MRRDPRVLMFGEGGPPRARTSSPSSAASACNTPLAEAVIAGTAAGAAAMGLRPVIDLLYAPFLTLSMDAIINSAGKLRYPRAGSSPSPWWCWPDRRRLGRGAQHNHSLEAMFVHAPGLRW